MFWNLRPTLCLPTLSVTPRRDRGVQGHTEWAERGALDSAIKSRNDKRKKGDKPPPSPASLRLDRRVYSQRCLPQRAVLRHGGGPRRCAHFPRRVGPPVKPEGYGWWR